MKNRMKKATLGRWGSRLLLWTLPLVLVQVIYMTFFVATKSGYEIAGSGELISLMLDGIGKSLILSVFASLCFDIAEKRKKT